MDSMELEVEQVRNDNLELLEDVMNKTQAIKNLAAELEAARERIGELEKALEKSVVYIKTINNTLLDASEIIGDEIELRLSQHNTDKPSIFDAEVDESCVNKNGREC